MLRVADLANLELTGREQESLLRDLNSILEYVAQLNEVDTSSVPAMAQMSDMIGGSSGAAASLRADDCLPSLDRSRVMACAPDSDHTFFLVPKVIER